MTQEHRYEQSQFPIQGSGYVHEYPRYVPNIFLAFDKIDFSFSYFKTTFLLVRIIVVLKDVDQFVWG